MPQTDDGRTMDGRWTNIDFMSSADLVNQTELRMVWRYGGEGARELATKFGLDDGRISIS